MHKRLFLLSAISILFSSSFHRCVSDIDYTWRFYIPEIDTFIDAGKGLSVWCKS